MRDVRTLSLERDGAGMRELLMLVTAVALLGAIAAVVFLRSGDDFPDGRIGYHAGSDERWVNALGEAADAPEGWSARLTNEETSPPAVVALSAEQVVSPDGAAIAYVSVAGERGWSVSRLMVNEGERVTELGHLGGSDGPQLVVGSKIGARSVDGVPLVIEWAPDGSKVAWGSVTGSPYNLHVAERGRWTPRSYPLEGGYVGELAWSGDGRYLAVSTYAKDRADHTLLVMDTLGNHGPQRLAKGCVVVWAPDSRHLVLHGEPRTQPGLLVISVDGAVRRVTERTDVAPFAWVAE